VTPPQVGGPAASTRAASRDPSRARVFRRGPGSRRSGPVLALALARAAWGSSLLLAPRGLLRSADVPSAGAGRQVVRVLGVRHLVQAAAQAGGSGRHRGGALVDLLHGLSVLALAAVDSRRRRAALADAALAAGFAVWEQALRAPPRARPPGRIGQVLTRVSGGRRPRIPWRPRGSP